LADGNPDNKPIGKEFNKIGTGLFGSAFALGPESENICTLKPGKPFFLIH